MHALDWIGQLMEVAISLIPRLVVVRQTHAGVVFRLGVARAIGPGWHVYWPLTSECVLVCTVRQSLNLSYQCLLTKDNHALVVAAIVVFRIESAFLAVTETDNIQDTIHDVSMSAIRRVINGCDFSEVHTNTNSSGGSIDAMLRRRLQADLSSYGVAIDRAFLSDISQPIIVRLLSDTPPS